MLIDMHTHMWLGSAEKNKRMLENVRERYGVSRIMLSSLGCFDPDENEIATLNDMTLAYMNEEPNFVSGYCYLNPRNANTLIELNRRLDQGMIGVKLWVATFCDDALVNPIVETCIRRGVPLLIHTFYKANGQLPYESLGENVAALARRYREAKLVMAHMGAACFRELEPIRLLENVSVDFSGSLAHADDLPYAVSLLTSKRVLFGTDGPLIGFHVSYGQLLEANLTQDQYDDIAWRNAQTLFLGGCHETL
jgi:predicted TIM-barrel fold metal-dependent hydrolase